MLRPGGLLALEIGIGQSETLLTSWPRKIITTFDAKHDYSGVTRFLLREVWIRFSFTAATRFPARSRSAARKIPRCRSSPPRCSPRSRASFITCRTSATPTTCCRSCASRRAGGARQRHGHRDRPRRSTRSRPTRSCAKCARRSACSVRCSAGERKRPSRCPAAASSAIGRSICI